MSEEVSPCLKCVNKREIPGDYHIACANPPGKIRYVGAVGEGLGGTFDERGLPNFESCEERIAYAKKVAAEEKAVVRCLWPECGFFPFGFDPNSVFACANFKEKEEQ